VKDFYQIVTVVDGKQDFAAIMQVLTDIKEGKLKNDLKVLSYYHNVPISYAAKIDSIDKDSLEVSINQAQAVVLDLHKQTFITSSHFPEGLTVHCYVEYVNVRNSFAVLGRFAYAANRAEKRGAVRVDVENLVEVEYRAGDQSFSGNIQNISIIGLAVESVAPKPVGIEDHGELLFVVQGNRMKIPATLVRTYELEHGFLHAFKIELDSKAELLVSQYVYTRQVEIIRELKDRIE
jgi:PilZ domain